MKPLMRALVVIGVLGGMGFTSPLVYAQDLEPLGDPLFPAPSSPSNAPEPVSLGDDFGFTPGVEDRGGPKADRTWLDLSAAMTFIKRSYALDSLDAGLKLDSSFYDTYAVGVEAYPLIGQGDVLEDIGIKVSYLRGNDTTLVNEGEVVRTIISRHTEFSLAATYRVNLTPELDLSADVGLYLLDFVLSDNPFYSSTTYRALWLGGQGRYQLLPWVHADAELGVFPVTGLGDSQTEFGESASTVGAVAGLGLETDLTQNLYVRVGYRLRWFSSSFEGQGDRGLEAVVTTDFFHDLALRLGYRL